MTASAGHLYRDAGAAWPDYRDEVLGQLTVQPGDAVTFAQHYPNDVRLAWELADNLDLDDHRTWSDLVKAYEKIDPVAVPLVHTRVVEHEATGSEQAGGSTSSSPRCGSSTDAGRTCSRSSIGRACREVTRCGSGPGQTW